MKYYLIYPSQKILQF